MIVVNNGKWMIGSVPKLLYKVAANDILPLYWEVARFSSFSLLLDLKWFRWIA
jgi:hypothetical protein